PPGAHPRPAGRHGVGLRPRGRRPHRRRPCRPAAPQAGAGAPRHHPHGAPRGLPVRAAGRTLTRGAPNASSGARCLPAAVCRLPSAVGRVPFLLTARPGRVTGMRLLMLGGTEFVGRSVVEAALGRGWEVTVLNRGRQEAPPGVRSLRGDRTAPDGLAALEEAPGDWDVVVDTWSTAPRAVRDTARLLHDRAARYVYVSSCSVYAWAPPAGYTERAPVVDGARADAD